MHPSCATGPADACDSDYCSICWTESLGQAPCVRLGCGHTFHAHCVKDRISKGWSGVRITFSFAECPLCGEGVVHPSLVEAMGRVNRLRLQVRAKALERLQYENGWDLSQVPALRSSSADPAGYALSLYAYYPCYKCKLPYFAGRVACERQGVDAPFDPTELVCGGCSDTSSATKCLRGHGKEYWSWKCRYCCNIATWFCWGTTRFCDDCHSRAATIARMDKKLLPKCSCGRKHAPHGEEFAYGCSLCAANSF
jgi:E3 ubiquitin-protein ligase MYCBP2